MNKYRPASDGVVYATRFPVVAWRRRPDKSVCSDTGYADWLMMPYGAVVAWGSLIAIREQLQYSQYAESAGLRRVGIPADVFGADGSLVEDSFRIYGQREDVIGGVKAVLFDQQLKHRVGLVTEFLGGRSQQGEFDLSALQPRIACQIGRLAIIRFVES